MAWWTTFGKNYRNGMTMLKNKCVVFVIRYTYTDGKWVSSLFRHSSVINLTHSVFCWRILYLYLSRVEHGTCKPVLSFVFFFIRWFVCKIHMIYSFIRFSENWSLEGGEKIIIFKLLMLLKWDEHFLKKIIEFLDSHIRVHLTNYFSINLCYSTPGLR